MSETTQDGSLGGGGAGMRPRTLVIAGPGLLRTKILAAGEVVIGRDAACDVQLDHARISRRHARLVVAEACSIEDLGSRNGTVVGGEKLGAGSLRALAAGEAFSVGPFSLVVVEEGQVASVAAPSSIAVDEPAPVTPPALLVTVARSPLTVLVRGESGAGKEVLAETLHRLSGRTGPLLRVNCASFTAELLDSELFGHERGAFTGAVATKAGLLEAAGGGTLFLDEVGELPGPLQAKLLRAIEGREVLRVGGTRPVVVDVRFIAATNRDLHAGVAAGTFRLDLYYRLAVITLALPPLRERPERIAQLAQELAAIAAARSGLAPPAISPGAIARLHAHGWPGNVRELRNTIERAVLLSAGGGIGTEHIVIDAPQAGGRAAASSSAATSSSSAQDDDERTRILAALDECAGNQTRAAKLLGISRATLVNKLALHKIPRPRG